MDVKTKRNFFSKAPLVFILAVSFLLENYNADSAEYPMVVISEVQISGGTGKTSEDFIELYNFGDKAFNLNGWQLKKRTKTGTETLVVEFKNGDVIPAKGHFLWANSGLSEIWSKSAEKIVPDSTSSATVASDNSIALFDTDKKLMDAVAWGSGHINPFMENEVFPINSSSNSFERKKDSNGFFQDTDNNKEDFATNENTNPVAGHCRNRAINSECLIVKEEKIYSQSLRINELFPNPSGDEKENEYIELYNFGETEIVLNDWFLKNRTNAKCFLEDKVPAKSYLDIKGKCSAYFLHNAGGEKIILYNPNSEEVSAVIYEGNAKEDVSYGFDGAGWRWSRHLTPGEPNAFDEVPGFEVKIDKKIYKNVRADFKVKSSDELKVTWDFGNGKKSYKTEANHTYEKTGKYRIALTVSTETENVRREFEIEVKKFPDHKVRIVKINPNPPGVDADSESLFIENKSGEDIDLEGWSVASGTTSKKLSNHPITEDLKLKDGKTLEITREFSKFTLGNKKAKIELRYPTGEVADDVEYETAKDVKEGMVYVKNDEGSWIWKMGDIEVFENIEDAGIGQDGLIVGDFGFGEEEDALEVISMLVDELERDLAGIYAQDIENQQEVQGVEIVEEVQDVQSVENMQTPEEVRYYDGISKAEKEGIFAKSVFVGNLPDGKPVVLGAQTVRAQGGEYRFTADVSDEPHYAAKFVRQSLSGINASLNIFLRRIF